MNEGPHRVKVLAIRWWSSWLVSFTVEKPSGYHFTAGQFARLGIAVTESGPVFRPFSMVSPPLASQLEFFAIIIPQGEFSEELLRLQVGHTLLLDQQAYGFLTLDRFLEPPPGHLWLLATGTGIAPFLSILQDAEAWRRYQHIVLVYSVRHLEDLAYQELVRHLSAPREGGAAFTYLPVITRDPSCALHEHIPALLESGRLQDEAGLALDADAAHVLLCGNPGMTGAVRQVLLAKGLVMNRRGKGNIAAENYWSAKH